MCPPVPQAPSKSNDQISPHFKPEIATNMTLTQTFATGEEFTNAWPAAVEALKRLHEEKIFLPNYHYELLHDAIASTSVSPAPNHIERCIRRLWDYDKRFPKIEPQSGGISDFSWAAYTCAYLVRDAKIATDLLTVFPPLLGNYISQELGKLFVQKTCLTFKALVMEQIWPMLAVHPDEPSGFFNWHACLNRMCEQDRKTLLFAAGLPALQHPSVPPEDVMSSFKTANAVDSSSKPYLSRLSQYYVELGYYHLRQEIETLPDYRQG
jgi:hypothetical protein